MSVKANKMILSVLKQTFGICRYDADKEIPERILKSKFFSVTRTSDELSLICPIEYMPADARCESNWKCLKVNGPLDFAQTGILSSLASVLAEAEISLLTFSTFETDYIMVKDVDLAITIKSLKSRGHQVYDQNIAQ